MSTLTNFTQHCTGGLTNEIRPEKLIIGIKTGKEETELWLFADNLTINIKNLQS